MKQPKQTREQRIRLLENVVMHLNDRLKNLESIIYTQIEDINNKQNQ
jgi:chaperonin cofactor prefoldin